MIGRNYEQNKVRTEITKILESNVTPEHQRNQIGKLLFNLSRNFGVEAANPIILDLDLTKKMNISVVCPLLK